MTVHKEVDRNKILSRTPVGLCSVTVDPSRPNRKDPIERIVPLLYNAARPKVESFDKGRAHFMAARILIADDEKDIVELIAFNLEKEGFPVLKAYDGETALELARSGRPDLLLLDLMLPGIPGLDLCRILRKDPRTASLPIIMVTAKGEEMDRVLGLEMGADDYVTKPFSVRELAARVRAVLRRRTDQEKTPEEIIEGGPLRVNLSTCEVFVGGRRVELSAKELRLLAFLARRPGRVYTREQILDQVWGDEVYVEPRTVDVHIKRLRARIEENPEKPRLIQTVRGIGYRLADGVPE